MLIDDKSVSWRQMLEFSLFGTALGSRVPADVGGRQSQQRQTKGSPGTST
jgi:hypothetical protein